MEHHVGIINLDDDKFVIKKSIRLIDLFEKWMLLEQLCVVKITETAGTSYS